MKPFDWKEESDYCEDCGVYLTDEEQEENNGICDRCYVRGYAEMMYDRKREEEHGQ